MQLNVRADVSKALSKLRDFPRNQIPFALASALTATARETTDVLKNKLPEVFDRPTPYTMRAIGFERATKQVPRARVFIKRDQLKYLTYGIDGGTRFAKKRAIPKPVNEPTNQYGNLPRNKVAALLKRRDVFSGTVNGTGGIWKRTSDGGLLLLIAWQSKATYRKRFPFFELGKRTVKEAFPRQFPKALANALRTAR